MNARKITLIDQSRNVLATAQVADEGGYYGGTIDLRLTPADVRALFQEFEEIVNGQMFVFLDDIQGKIGSFGMKALIEDDSEVCINDLQVFPSTGAVSFRYSGIPCRGDKQA